MFKNEEIQCQHEFHLRLQDVHLQEALKDKNDEFNDVSFFFFDEFVFDLRFLGQRTHSIIVYGFLYFPQIPEFTWERKDNHTFCGDHGLHRRCGCPLAPVYIYTFI